MLAKNIQKLTVLLVTAALAMTSNYSNYCFASCKCGDLGGVTFGQGVDLQGDLGNNELILCGVDNSAGNSAENPIIVRSYEDLAAIATAVNNGDSYKGKFIKLGNDINITELELMLDKSGVWTSIGDKDGNNRFEGTFDGDNYSIVCDIGGFFEPGANSIFGTIGESGSVSNLSIVDSIFSTRLDAAAVLCRANYGSIKNCNTNVDITGLGSVCSIAAENYGTIVDCLIQGTLTVDNQCCAGVAIKNNGIIKSCHVNSIFKILEQSETSKLCGVTIYNNKDAKVEDCLVTGNLFNEFSGSFSEDLSPNAPKGSVAAGISFFNAGVITANSYIGDIRADAAAGICTCNEGTVDNCGVSSNVKGLISAGICDVNRKEGTIKNCCCIANISSGYHTGGVAAVNEGPSSFDDCLCEIQFLTFDML